jgi:hypothetical protein
MTKDYNKQPHDDTRSSYRGQSPNRAGEERTPRPPRPRLNRATVDRAWETGAPAQHADYRVRSGNGQPSRNGWRKDQPSEHSSAQPGRRPYEANRPNRPYGNQRDFERTPNGNVGSHPRSFDANRERYDNQRPGSNDRPGSPGGFQKRGYQGRGYQSHGNEGQNGHHDFNGQTRDFKRDERSPRSFERKPGNFERDSRPPRNFDRQARDNAYNGNSPRSFERGEPRRNNAGDKRPFYPAGQRDAQNPRWQSRPAARQDSFSQERPDVNKREGELFEGDYEHFDTTIGQHNVKPGRPYKGNKKEGKTRVEPEERHVTRLPDGRVLKGSRPAQRKEAQFWTGIANETEGLIKQVETPETLETLETLEAPVVSETSTTSPEEKATREDAVQSSPAQGKEKPKALRKPRSHAASAIASNKKEKKKAAKPRSTGPKPSQHGYKWPSPEQ